MTEAKKGADTRAERNRLIPLRIPRTRNAKNDILSGLTVAFALVPEAIAFAFVAGVDPKVGLYAAFMMGLITAIFGGRPGMISGATGAVAVIFAPMVAKVMEMSQTAGMTGPMIMESTLQYLFAAVIIMGMFQIVFGLLKLGKFIRLVPHPVMLGFVNGLAIIIFLAQFKQFTAGGELLPTHQLTVMAVLIALTMAIGILLPKLTRAVPATLVGIIVTTIVGLVINKFHPGLVRTVLDFVQDGSPTTTTIAAGLPTFNLPGMPFTLEAFKLIIPYSFLAAAVGLIESLMTLTLIDEITETRGQSNRECIGQGIANIVNGFFGGMGGCAMIGQSMINIRGGGRGRLSGIVAAVFLICFLLFIAPLIELIPLAALVGVMFLVVIGTFEWSSFRLFGKIPAADFAVIVIVSAVTVIADLAIAVFVGIIVSALVFAWKHNRIMDASKRTEENRTIYTLRAPLFFGSASSFKELFDFNEDDTDHIVINFDNYRVWDQSGVEALNNVSERYAQKGKKVHLINLNKESLKVVKKMDDIVDLNITSEKDLSIICQ